MKLCAVSPFETASTSEILAFLANTTADLVMLPGYSSNSPSPEQVRAVIRSEVSVFVEDKAFPYLVKKGELARMPIQIFCKQPSAKHMDGLVAKLPERTFSITSRKITFLLCGEIMAFNPDGSCKHNRQLPFDILANPAHTPMGRWNHLGKKLANLSRRSVVLHAANNNRNHNRFTTDVRIYNNSELANRQNGKMLSWSECEI